jgi:antitoxin MazE
LESDFDGQVALKCISRKMYLHLERIMQVAKWGNSLAVRIPAKTVKALSLKEGDKVELELTVVSKEGEPSAAEKRAAALERLVNMRGNLTQADLRYDREDLYQR